ncbi:MAG: tRNA (N(6)-L-threonylcarbamoyladenosine(37)-C(2))-methylthiotransferase [Candidatus Thermoplasmatota archaeon]|nr:tRNA (N(6)-L-threonylcarbamoyladenosine(37)-C(2))-methylthiotransferase [Candidatus Thermoplasmatota archaeon]
MELGKVAVESYGCTMSHGEGRRAAEILSSMGVDVKPPGDHTLTDDVDTVIIFTCDVISHTERRMWRRMEEVAGVGKRLVVGGCLAAVSPDEIALRFPHATVIDTMGLDRLERSMYCLAGRDHDNHKHTVFWASPGRMDAIVPVSTGCAGNCSYCITRLARGCIRSYPVPDIVDRIKCATGKGRKEVLLTSQDMAAYGIDTGSGDLGSLLGSITSSMDVEARIRVGMMNPMHARSRLRSILPGFDHPFVFKFFHVPVQSGSDGVLAEMRRGYTISDLRDIFGSIRSSFPMALFSTDIIVGFPGETVEDHRMSLDLIEEITPEVLNITRFSPRPGTEAEGMPGHVSGWLQKERSRELTKLHGEVLRTRLKERMGHHESCLVTEVGRKGTMMARDPNYLPIVIEGGKEILGAFVDVDTSGAGPTYLLGGREWKLR